MVNLGHSGHLSIFTLLKHLMMLLKYNFFSVLHFDALPKTLIPFRTISKLRFFFYSETLLNNAFNLFFLFPSCEMQPYSTHCGDDEGTKRRF